MMLTDLSIQLCDLLLGVCELSGELGDGRLQGQSSVLGRPQQSLLLLDLFV